VDLAFERVDGAQPEQAIAFLHGILGRGLNLRTIARRFVEARPKWSAWLVDLRGHGRSPKGTPAPSIEAAARDVLDLSGRADLPVAAIFGHSFGGKVALEVARLGSNKSLDHVFIIDSVPGAREPLRGGDSALAVIDTIESLSPTFPSKTDFIHALVSTGQARTLAEWLAGSLAKENDHVRFALNLDEIRGMLLDYFARDLWPVVEHPREGLKVHLLIAADSDSYSKADRDHALRIARANTQVTVDILPGGHWLHVDNADGVLAKLVEYVNAGGS
jgi:pimeloyl-ACP methyl ester carboxylesterase